MKESIKKEYFSIPNLMGYFRLLVVPVYLYLYITAEDTKDYYIAAAVMAVSFLTDFFDGKIARKFNMVTEFGKILDPVADKVTQCAMAVSFSFRFPAMAVLVVVFLIKEGFMAVAGAVMMKKGYRMDGARMHGKVCTAVLDVVMLIILVCPDISFMAVNIMTGVSIAFMLFSFTKYAVMYWNVWKKQKGES